MSAVELENLTLTRGARTILSNVSASIGEDEFIGVFGPNGAGKTTLLHAILGLLPPASGTIRQGAIERSNVDLALSMTELMNLQRSFQLDARALSLQDGTIGEATQLGRLR